MRTAAFYALSLCACAQQVITSASVAGRVEDASGAPIRGAAVEVLQLERNVTWTAITDEAGRYRFAMLPPGSYRITVRQPSFAAGVAGLTLSIGQALEVPFRLEVAGIAAQVDVTADAPVVETTRTQFAHTVSPAEIEALPLNGRNYLDLALLAPGVSRTNTGTAQRFAETSAVPGTGLSINSQRNLNNSFIVDGLSANDDAAGLAGTFLSQEVIREFQVVSAGGIAEFGRASAGVVNVATRSGGNEWQGRVYGFARNDRFDARNAFATRKDPLRRAQYGAGGGGPLERDRTFLFSNFEQTREDRAGFVTIAPQSVARINSIFPAGIETGEYPSADRATNLFTRIDRSLSGGKLLAVRYSQYDISSLNARTAGGLNAVSRGSGLFDRDQTLAVTHSAAPSARTLAETRAQFTRSRLWAPVNDPLGPAVNIAGVASFGAATFSPTGRTTNLAELVETVSTVRGSHSLKTGADVLYNRVAIEFPGPAQGVYTFSSLDNFLGGRYVTFTQAFGRTGQVVTNPNAGAFVQEEWRPFHSLTLNAGLRYDVQKLPAPIRTDTNNLSPRFGLAWSPGSRLVVRAGYGIYYDRIPLRAVSNALQRDGAQYRTAVVAFGEAGAPAFPQTLDSFPAGLLTAVTAIDPGIRPAYSQQGGIQVERELARGTSLSAGYTWLRGLHLLMSRNVNVPTLPAAEAVRLGIPNLGRPDPRFANVNRYEGAGDSYYDGLTIALKTRRIRVSYTLSKAIDNAGNFFFGSPQDNFNLRGDRGLGDNDQRHRLAVSGSARLPGALELSYILAASSALPFNVLTGTDRNFDTNVNDRPAGVGRNTGRGFSFASLDVRVSRKFALSERISVEAIAEAFNLLNRTNYLFPNGVFGAGAAPLASFGRPTAAADPRQMQFGIRIGR